LLVALLASLVSVGAFAQNVIGIGVQPATTFATSVAQCPTLTSGAFICVVVPSGAQPFLALSVAGWNSGKPFQLAGLFATGTLTPGNLVVSGGGNSVVDGGAVPVVPANVVTAPMAIPVGHLAITGTAINSLVDGGAPPVLPNFSNLSGGITCPNATLTAGALKCPAGSSIQ
jgi:hypothetical protein